MACIQNLHPKVGGNTSQPIPAAKHNSARLLTKKKQVRRKSNGLFTVNLLPAPLIQVVTSMFIYRTKNACLFFGGGGGAKDSASNSGFLGVLL